MTTGTTTVTRLRELECVRERSYKIYDLVKDGRGRHFDLDEKHLEQVASYVATLIKRDFESVSKIPPHGRWQHLDAGFPRIDEQLLLHWRLDHVDEREQCRRLIDLFVISVLLDAGAGNSWKYTEKSTGKVFTRSEGIAVASFHIFLRGGFSSGTNQAQVDAHRLKAFTAEELARGLQVTPDNPIADLQGRVKLLNKLGHVLSYEDTFQPDGRPGHIIDFCGIYKGSTVKMHNFWRTIILGYQDIWDRDKRIVWEAKNLGDVWPSDTLPNDPADPLAHFVPFHKLSQWLTYSLMTPMYRTLGVLFEDTKLLTGLPEYRNGGLFVDFGVLSLKDEDSKRGLSAYSNEPGVDPSEAVPLFQYNDPVVVEWRALTVVLLDKLHQRVKLYFDGEVLGMAQMLEAGSWKGGRETAAEKRPKTRGPPIMVVGDGTLF